MAENKMLIDATHPEETRVVVLREGRVEEFDYESAARKLLRGSIFLAKITRVEPSLQAAFVDYGGNRHGFLAFNEIHPDYYQIPHADRQALLDEENAAHSYDRDDEMGEQDEPREKRRRRRSRSGSQRTANANGEQSTETELDDGDDRSVAEMASPELIDQLEDAALDVSELLPAEPVKETDADDQPAEVEIAALASSEETPSVADDDVVDAASVTAGRPEAPISEEAAAGPSDTDDGPEEADRAEGADDEPPSDEEPKPPKSIAAATPPEDRIVSDEVEQSITVPGPISEMAEEVGLTAPSEEEIIQAEAAGSVKASDVVEVAGEAPESEPVKADLADEPAEDDGGDEAEGAADDADAPSDPDDQPEPVARNTNDEDDDSDDNAAEEIDEVDDVGDTDAMEEVPVRRRRRARSYKIQEVIKRRQIVLVQVVKEERGNKGAALTTYLSLAGRYTVLMPNTARGGGISRKITNIQDRKRLKAIAQELDVPEGMGLIIRTAGAARTKQEIKRDFEYLLRLWESVRDLTLQSTAPSLVYEEGDLIKRSIRDLYSKDVEQVLVAGEEAHKEAKSFMRMLMPSHAKNVIKYEDPQPLFTRYRIEQQLNAMFSPFVQLKSGGYLVINQTEALVAVDVNSGKSTRKFSIEDTALNTNIEAAEELSRQLKLRDLAGLIVIDFIDMEEKRNNRAVERRLKECLRDDRARIQVGRISHFGLLEMSRQRLRTGVLEGSTMPCQHCQGTGIIRSTESVALAVLRALEDNLMSGTPRSLVAQCSRDAAMYLLNQKREFVQEIETRYGISIHIQASDAQQGADFTVERVNGGPALPRRIDRQAVNVDSGFDDEAQTSEARNGEREESDERRPRRRRRRRGRRGEGETEARDSETDSESDIDSATSDGDDDNESRADNDDGEERSSRRRRRGRRGGRRNRGERGGAEGVAEPGAPQPVIGAQEDPTGSCDAVAGSESAQDAEPPVKASAGATDDDNADIVDAATEGSVEANLQDGAPAATEAVSVDTADDEVGSGPEDKVTSVDPEEAEPATGVAANDDVNTEAAVAAASSDEAPSEDAASGRGNGRTGEPQSSEPVLERVVLSPKDSGGETLVEDADAAPARKGWWQRRFGG